MAYTKEHKPDGEALPAFWGALRDGDAEIIALQNKRRPFGESRVIAVARRCVFGFPQVVVSSPLSRTMTPFPTLFWLTCPFLKRRCGELESQRKIAELEKIFAAQPEQVSRYHADYAALRMSLLGDELRRELSHTRPALLSVLEKSGVGGINYESASSAPKCLHLQTAAWLGMGCHPAASWLAAEIGSLACSSGSCDAA